MKKCQLDIVRDLQIKFDQFIAIYGIGTSSCFLVFEDNDEVLYILTQAVTLNSEYTGPNYNTEIKKIDSEGIVCSLDTNDFGSGGYIEFLKNLKRVNTDLLKNPAE